MHPFFIRVAVCGALTILPAIALAHDEAAHAETAEIPDCEAMKTMDHSKMKKDDPVMQAMMKKCMAKNDMHSDNERSKSHGKLKAQKEENAHQH